jgi:hypothetical protein
MIGGLLVLGLVSSVLSNPLLGSEKAQALRDLAAVSPNSLIRLNATGFDHYVLEYPRPYTLVVLFTADNSKYKCKVCTELKEVLHNVIYSYVESGADFPYKSPTGVRSRAVFFAVMEYGLDTQDLFVRHGFKSVPVLFVTHPKSVVFDGNRYHLPREDVWEFHAGSDVYEHKLLEFVNNRSHRDVEIKTPPIQSFLILLNTALCLAGGVWVMFKVRRFLLSPYVWFIVTIIVYYLCISGVVYDIIHKTPMTGRNQKTGAVEYIHSGVRTTQQRSQYAAEGFLMGMCATVASLCLIGLHNFSKLENP